MADRSVVVRLLANIADFKQQMDQAQRSVKGVGDQSEKTSREATTTLGRMAASAQKNRAAWDDAGMALAGFGAVTAVALGATVKAAIDWESAWAGVTKTVSGTPEQLAEIETGLRDLARTLPATHGEIAAVAEAAGQLGVKTEGIVAFTRTMVDLGQTTNLSADEAATSLAQLMNVMGTAPDDVGRLGASLVALGNAGASTEKDILNLASYITGSAKLIGASESDVLALANAMTSMGINAERGGGVMTRVMQDIYAAVQSGGDQLAGFAEVAGMSSAEFAKAFEADPIRAIDTFVQGLNGVEKSGGNVVETLGNLGYVGTQDTAVLLQLKGAGDLLTESLDLGNKAWEENTALVEEAAKRYDTTAGQLAIARNNVHDAAIEIGDFFLPILADLAGGLADVAGWFADLPDPIQGTIGGLAGVAGVAALAGGGFLLLFPRVIETYKAFQTLQAATPGVASGLGKVGKAAAIAGVVIAATAAIDGLVSAMLPAPPTMEETTAALLGMKDGLSGVDSMFKTNGADVFTKGIDGLAEAADKLANPSLINRLDDFGGELLFWQGNDGRVERDLIIDQLGQMGDSLALMVESGNAELAAQQFELLAEEWKRGGGTVEDLRDLMPAYDEALQGVANDQKTAAETAQQQAEKTAVLAADLDAAYGSIAGYAAAMGLSEEATKELITRTSELGTTLADFVDPLGAYTGLLEEKKEADRLAAEATAAATESSTDSWQDYVTDVGFSFDEYMRRLEEQVTAQADWQTNMLVLAGRVSQGTLEELARMGPEGAPLVADLVNRSDAELDRFDEIAALRSKEATDAWGAQLTMASPVLAAIAGKAGKGAADAAARELSAGTKTIAEIAAQYGIALANGVNPILQSLGKPFVGPTNYRPGSPTFMGPVKNADGNLYEDHVAQIAPGGAWRVWAEPETGGEAYIPLSPAKRTRSVDIWRKVGDRLGVQFQEFAFGGINDVPRPPSTAPFRPPVSTAADATMEKAFNEVRTWVAANVEPPAASGGSSTGLLPIMAAARQYVMDTYGVRNIGGFARRNIAGTNTLSDHAMGKAIDVMTTDLGLGWRIANDFAFGEAHRRFNIENTIWQQSISSRGGPFRGMADRGSPTQNHMDHVHGDTYANGAVVDFLTRKGGMLNPHVRDTGGPLLPGYTFNGTGGPETVIPDHLIDARAHAPAVTAVSVPAPIVRVFLDGQEWRGIARVEAEGVVIDTLTGIGDRERMNG